MRTAKLLPGAQEFYNQASPNERIALKLIVDGLCRNPAVDNKTTFAVLVGPAIMTLYADGTWWVLFHLPNDTDLDVMAFGLPGDKVRIRKA